ncbi:MAG: nitroreductase family protein [Clostridia bacterium]|nr:nitroreductase family protein [Clostridia bacterium]
MLKDLILATRSYRSFDPAVSVTEDQLRSLVDHARFTASSINLQALKFRLVTDTAERDAVQSSVRWATKVRDIIELPPKGHGPAAFIVICTDTGVSPIAEKLLIDVGIAAEAIMLAASEMGLGGCMMSSFSKQDFPTVLGLPDGVSPQLVLALGKPDEEVRLTDPAADGSVTYYRENGIHYVRKRRLDDLIVK